MQNFRPGRRVNFYPIFDTFWKGCKTEKINFQFYVKIGCNQTPISSVILKLFSISNPFWKDGLMVFIMVLKSSCFDAHSILYRVFHRKSSFTYGHFKVELQKSRYIYIFSNFTTFHKKYEKTITYQKLPMLCFLI